MTPPDGGVAPFNSAAEKSASGALSKISFCRPQKLSIFLSLCRQKDFRLYATDAHKGKMPWEIEFAPYSMIMIGSESAGLRPHLKREADECICIPLGKEVESLNANAALSIILYERQKKTLCG